MKVHQSRSTVSQNITNNKNNNDDNSYDVINELTNFINIIKAENGCAAYYFGGNCIAQ